MVRIHGTGASAGIAIGRLTFLKRGGETVPKKAAADPDGELKRLKQATEETAGQLGEIYQKSLRQIGEKDSMIFEIHRMMLEDEDFLGAIRERILGERVNAEYAVWSAGKEFSDRLARMDSEYMRNRAPDVLDVSSRLIRSLQKKGERDDEAPRSPSVIGAEDLMPSETVQLDKAVVLAFVTRNGSKVSHSAILARTLGIPSVVGLGDGYRMLRDGMTVIVDGTAGEVLAEPDEAALREYRAKQEELRLRRERLEGLTGAQAVTKNGVRIAVNANIGRPGEAELALRNGADGVGLFRSEFLYMESDSLPSEETQFRAYREALEKMRGKRVIIRTLDIGADKRVPYLNLPHEENPALGWRAIRICLDRTELFRTQLRALLRASAFGNLAVMFPMVISPQEVREAKKLVGQVKGELRSEGTAFSPDVPLGVMIETPAAAVLSAELAKEADFFSIGTNDLTQYTLAADRMNGNVAKLYDQRHPAVLRLIELTVKNAKAAGIETGICGESAADPVLTEFFLRIGVDELSVAPASVPELKNTVRGIELR